ncbi:MAG: hypothetical protein ACRD3D_06050 [Terriglobia bacterium]
MDERDFYDEMETMKPARLACLYCRQADTYDLRWKVRTKRKALRGGGSEEDRLRFAKWQPYMVRRDDFVQCKNPRCRKRFEVSGIQSIVFSSDPGVAPSGPPRARAPRRESPATRGREAGSELKSRRRGDDGGGQE